MLGATARLASETRVTTLDGSGAPCPRRARPMTQETDLPSRLRSDVDAASCRASDARSCLDAEWPSTVREQPRPATRPSWSRLQSSCVSQRGVSGMLEGRRAVPTHVGRLHDVSTNSPGLSGTPRPPRRSTSPRNPVSIGWRGAPRDGASQIFANPLLGAAGQGVLRSDARLNLSCWASRRCSARSRSCRSRCMRR
jgi:hypothetical protein